MTATDARHQAMTDFLGKALTGEYRIESLAGDASFRRYHRIYQGDSSYLLMDAPPEKESVDSFVTVAGVLSSVVNVPDILYKDMAAGFLLLQDFGVVEFAHEITDGDNASLYKKALESLKQLQSLKVKDAAVSAYIPPYSCEKLLEEMALFWDWFLPYVGYQADETDTALWKRFTDAIARAVEKQPDVVVHRDYHSRNLMLDKNSDRLGVIDFQDALVGSYVYDLVSLVRDAYIRFDEAWVADRLKDAYEILAVADDFGKDFPTFLTDVNVMGVQRHLKVLGIFVRLCQRDGKTRYLADIPTVMKDLLAELTYLGGADTHDAQIQAVSAEFLAWLEKNITPLYEKKFL